ncbi:MAG: hypothetical protein IJ553_00870 [Alloprevotella sp.]|nr:hypothetical protein [Alloprevotella sp.]
MITLKPFLKGSLILVCAVLLCSSRSANPIDDQGRYKGVCLKGNVYISQDPYDDSAFKAYCCTLPDDADLYVYFVESGVRRRPGHWTIVRHREDADFCVYLMGSFEYEFLHIDKDFNVYAVDNWHDAGVMGVSYY